MKVSKKELYLLLALVGVIVAVCAFQFGFKKINEKTAVLRTETETLESEVKYYMAIKDNIDTYQQGIEDSTTRIAGVLNEFPINVLPEDAFMLGRELEKNVPDTFVSSAAMGTNVNVYTATSHPVEPTTIPISYALYKSELSLSYTASYDGVKDIFDYIYDHTNRMAVDNISLSYDSTTGMLSATSLVNMYYVLGSDKQYSQQNLSGVGIGTDNIFGTIDTQK